MPSKTAKKTDSNSSKTKLEETVDEATSEATNDKKERGIDLEPFIAQALAALPEECEIEISSVVGGGKRVDLIRGDGTITRLLSGADVRTSDVKHFLLGLVKGRLIG